MFKYYATGRYNFGYLLATLELFKRQELFNVLFWSLVTKEQDKVSYEIPIKQEVPNPVVLAICKTSQLKAIRSSHLDVKTLTKICHVGVQAGYVVLAENDETAEWVFNSNVVNMIKALGNTIEYIYVTDQATLIEQYPLTLTSSFVYPSEIKTIDTVVIQAQLVVSIADYVSKLALSNKVKAIAEKERANMNKEKMKEIKQQREEERLQKKQELKKKDEEKLQGLSKEQKRRIEERNYKKELKKKGLKFKMVKA